MEMIPESEPRIRGDQGDWRPRPDPTVLTTEALHREIATLKSLLDERLRGADVLTEEKFAAVEKQFILIERQRVEQKLDTEKAVAAALQAAKEVVGEQTAASEKSITKSEGTTTREIEALKATFSTAFESSRREIDSTKERIAAVEQQKVGGTEAKAGVYGLVTLIVIGLPTLAAIVTHGFR